MYASYLIKITKERRLIMKQKLAVVMFLVCFLLGCNSTIETRAVAKEGPVLEVSESIVELGVISEELSDFIGPVTVSNKGSEELKIINITGSCDCFKSYEGDRVIKPGSEGEIFVIFDKNKIQAGEVSRTVTIASNDPTNKEVDVTFNFTVERDAKSEEIRVLRSEMAILRKELHVLRSDIRLLANALKGANLAKPSTKTARKTTKRPPDTTVYDVAVGSSPVLGMKTAPVTITEFVDLQCPYCIREYPKIKEVLKTYDGKVQVVFKHYPLSFHAKAKPVHAAVQLALQEKGNDAFWKMHDMIMAEPKKLEIADLRGYAEKLGLNLDNFDKTMADKDAIKKLLEADMAIAKKCKVRGTPTVMINGLKLADRSIDAYKARIDQILKGGGNKPVAKKAPCGNCAKKGCNDCGGKGCKGCDKKT
jgi:protein-disulfide isomerase